MVWLGTPGQVETGGDAELPIGGDPRGSGSGLATEPSPPLGIGQREEQEFTTLYGKLQRRANAIAYRIVRNWADAEEAVSEAFADAFEKWDFICHLPHREWLLLRMVSNKAVDEARRRSRRLKLELQAWDRPCDLDSHEAALLREDLNSALSTLTARQREVAALRLIEGLSEPEVAKELEVNVGTVKQHLHRARARLRVGIGNPNT